MTNELSVLLRAAGGRPDDALALARAGLSPQAWAALPKAVARGEAGVMADWAPAQVVEALQKLCHDLVLRGSGAEPRFFMATQLADCHASVMALTDWFKRLMQSARTAEHPFNAGLMLEALANDAQQVLNARDAA